MENKKMTRIVLTALFAALAFVATYIIKVPTVGTNGYVNIGDTIVLLCAWMIGGVYGGLAAGVGSALSDLIAGYGMYVPGTFVIKFLMAVVTYFVFNVMKKVNVNKVIGYVISGILAELIMVLGYFLYESIVLGYGLGAALSIGSNFVQAGTCLVLGYALIGALEGARVTTLIRKYV
ncbi:MAG: ECF transporter S component [Eubacterium sp.]|nr:ECF transporter S component [Eubacterium sp.]